MKSTLSVVRQFLRERAFTLIELLIVILIIGILVAVAAPSFLGQVSKAQDSVAQQNLYNVYISGKGAYAGHDTYPYVGDPTPNLGCPGDSAVNLTFSTDCDGGASDPGDTGSLFSYLDDAEPEFVFANGVNPTDVNQIEVGEPNPQEVYYADQSASGHIFCLVDVEQSDADTNYVPAGTYHLESDSVPSGCATAPSPTDPPDITITSAPPAETTSTSATIDYDEGGDVTATDCTLDGSSVSCASGDTSDTPDTASFSGLGLGPHVFTAEVTGTGASAPSDTATADFTVVTDGGGSGPGGSPSGGCSAPLVLNTTESACVNPLGLTHYKAKVSPDVSDVILNEINEGEASVPSGDVRLSVDIQDFSEAGTFKFEVSPSKNFSDTALIVKGDSDYTTPGTLDNVYEDRDYHVDFSGSDLTGGTDNDYYWRATATTSGGTTTSCVASFHLNGDGTGTAINNIGDDCESLGDNGNPADANNGETVASNGGLGATTVPLPGMDFASSGDPRQTGNYYTSYSQCPAYSGYSPYYYNGHLTATLVTPPATLTGNGGSEVAWEGGITTADYYEVQGTPGTNVSIPAGSANPIGAWDGNGCYNAGYGGGWTMPIPSDGTLIFALSPYGGTYNLVLTSG
jgi:prepilin-type N-terminal cleavage/methylation domain-containing protein